MFERLSPHARTALFAVIMISAMPVEIRPRKDEIPEYCWSQRMALKLLKEMNLSQSYFEAYSIMIDDCYETIESDASAKPSMNAFLSVLREGEDVKTRNMFAIIDLIIFFVVNDMFDGKGRLLIRNLLKSIPVTKSDILAIEYHLRFTIIDAQEALSHSLKKQDKRKKMIRYAKIGAVSLGAGALLAVTGGLAAPAIASGRCNFATRVSLMIT